MVTFEHDLCFSVLQGLDGIGRKRKGEDVNEISYSGSSVGRGIHRTDAKKEDFKTYGAEYKAKVTFVSAFVWAMLQTFVFYLTLLSGLRVM